MTPLARPLSVVSIALVLAFGASCTYVTQADREEKFDSLDEDGDGVAKGQRDCDDNDPNRSPLLDEVPYDGIDNDCDKSDRVDVDRDGYPGITKTEYLASFPDAEDLWPQGLKQDNIRDCADDPEVVPQAAQVFPGNPGEIPYDGLDGDCGCDNDYDADGDGHMPPTVQVAGEVLDTEPLFDVFIATFCSDFPRNFDDCDDLDETVNPNQSDDAPYDGIDQDCGGDNDFDADGDGWMPDEDLHGAAYQTFLNLFHGGEAPASWAPASFGDCLDIATGALAWVDPAQANPGEVEVFYDGIDGDCGADNDFDADDDGWIRNGDVGGLQDYVVDWGYDLPVLVGDCDDTLPAVNPAAIEVLGNGVDDDCDGSEDTTPFGFADLEWTAPRAPRIAGTDNHYVIASGADELKIGPGVVLTDVGVAIPFALDAGKDATYTGDVVAWQGLLRNNPMGMAVDIVGDGDDWVAATTYTDPPNSPTDTFVMAVRYRWNGQDSLYERGAEDRFDAPVVYDALDVDLALDSTGEPFAWSCDSIQLHALDGDNSNGDDQGAHVTPVTGGTCFIEPPIHDIDTVASVCDGGGCETWEFGGGSIELAASQPRALDTIRYGDQRDDYVLYIDDSGLWVDAGVPNRVLSTPDAVHGDVALLGSIVYAVAAVRDGADTDVILVYGDLNAPPLIEQKLPLAVQGDEFDATGVAIWADAQRVVVAASGTDLIGGDLLGWAFFSP